MTPWTRETFQGKAAEDLLKNFIRVKNACAIVGIRDYTTYLQGYFARIRDQVIDRAVSRKKKAVPTEVSLDFGGGDDEDLWGRALQEVFAEQGQELVISTTAKVQKTAVNAFKATTVLINGDDPDRALTAHENQQINSRVSSLCSKVTGINATLQAKMRGDIQKSIDDGKTVYETGQDLKDRWPQIAENRIPTIARTEMGRAADAGMKQGLKACDQLGYISVIGCEAIEPGIPTYKGVPTCNICNVPAKDMDELEFHINHTGCIVPSGFRGEDGHLPPRQVVSGGSDLDPEGMLEDAEVGNEAHEANPAKIPDKLESSEKIPVQPLPRSTDPLPVDNDLVTVQEVNDQEEGEAIPKTNQTIMHPDGSVTHEGIKFLPRQRQKLAMVDVVKADASWSKETSYYVGPGGTQNAIGGRYEGVRDYLSKNKTITASSMYVDKKGRVIFEDGRHRFAFLRDSGMKKMPVSMDRDGIKNAVKYGIAEKLPKPSKEDIVIKNDNQNSKKLRIKFSL